MRKLLIILVLATLSILELYSRNLDQRVPSRTDNCLVCQSEYIDTVMRVYAIENGSESVADFGLVEGLEGYLKRNWTTVYEYLPERTIWEWSYENLEVDTLSVVNRDILSLLDYYDGKIGVESDCNVWCMQFDDNLNRDSDKKGMSIDSYRKYYILRIDTVRNETIIYYSLGNRAIEDIFENPDTMRSLDPIMGYTNYEGRPILIAGSGADTFFKRDSTIVMSPTYRKRVERSSGKGDSDDIYLIGELKGFFIYRDGKMEFFRTGTVPPWEDSDLYYDYIRRYYRE